MLNKAILGSVIASILMSTSAMADQYAVTDQYVMPDTVTDQYVMPNSISPIAHSPQDNHDHSNSDYGIKIGHEYVYSDLKIDGTRVSDGDNNIRTYAEFKFNNPSMPSAFVEHTTHGNGIFGYNETSATGFYKVFDNELIAIEAGLGLTYFTGIDLPLSHGNEIGGHAYSSVSLALPHPGTFLYSSGKVHSGFGVNGYTLNTGAEWEQDIIKLPVDVSLRAGYKFSSIKFNDADDAKVKENGFFIGIDARF